MVFWCGTCNVIRDSRSKLFLDKYWQWNVSYWRKNFVLITLLTLWAFMVCFRETAALNWKCRSINCAHINYFLLFAGSTYWWCLRKLLLYSMRRTKVSENQTASIFSVTKATHSFNKLVGVFYHSTWQNIPQKISNFLPSACRKKAVSHTSYPRTFRA